MNVKLLLIEDELTDAKKIMNEVKQFKTYVDENEERWQFEIEHLPGAEKEDVIKDRHFRFYNDDILEQIEEKIAGQIEKTRMGLLLDVVLTKDEWDSKNKSIYPDAIMARKIYSRFCDEIPIYIITSVSSFYVHSERIMGVDLSDRFILKEVLCRLKLEPMKEKLQKYYVEYWNGIKNEQRL